MSETTTEPTSAEREEALAKRLEEKIDSKMQSDNTLARLIADPDVRKLVEAKNAGKKVSVVEGETPPTEPVQKETFETTDLDAMSNTDLANLIVGEVSKTVEGIVDKKLGSFEGKIGSIENFVNEQESNTLRTELVKAREKYKDFEDQNAEMLEIHKSNPGLTVEELYLLAKRRKGEEVSSSPRVSTERPSTAVGRPDKRSDRKTPLPAGRKGMRQLLNERLEAAGLE